MRYHQNSANVMRVPFNFHKMRGHGQSQKIDQVTRIGPQSPTNTNDSYIADLVSFIVKQWRLAALGMSFDAPCQLILWGDLQRPGGWLLTQKLAHKLVRKLMHRLRLLTCHCRLLNWLESLDSGVK